MGGKRKLNVGLVGYGFMGRTHSNAFRQGQQFFDLAYSPVLKAVCGATRPRCQAFAEQWGYESHETDWRKLVARQDIDLDRHRQSQRHARRDRHRRREAGKMVMCEKPLGRNGAEAEKMVQAVESAGVAEHGLVQLPPRSGRHAGQATDRRRPARPDLSLPREVSAGLDDLGRSAAGRRRACGVWTSRWPAAA